MQLREMCKSKENRLIRKFTACFRQNLQGRSKCRVPNILKSSLLIFLLPAIQKVSSQYFFRGKQVFAQLVQISAAWAEVNYSGWLCIFKNKEYAEVNPVYNFHLRGKRDILN